MPPTVRLSQQWVGSGNASTVHALQDFATAISKDILKQVLAVLVKAKILINEETDQYDLNPGMFASLSMGRRRLAHGWV